MSSKLPYQLYTVNKRDRPKVEYSFMWQCSGDSCELVIYWPGIFMFQMCMVHKGKPQGGRSPFCLTWPVLQATWCHGVAEQAAKVAGVRWGQPQVNLKSCWIFRTCAASAPRLSAGWRDGQLRWELRSHGHRTQGQSWRFSCAMLAFSWAILAFVMLQVGEQGDNWCHMATGHNGQSLSLSCKKLENKLRTVATWP